MRRNGILILGWMAMVAALCVFIYWPREGREPVYQGKRLGAWLEAARLEGLDSVEGDFRPALEDARNAVRSAGPNALPWLLAQFGGSRSSGQLHPGNDELVALHSIEPGARSRVSRAAIGIHLLGPEAVPVLPTLAEYFGKGARGYSAAYAMSGMGEGALPWLREASLSTNPAVARQAMSGLGQLADSSAPAAEAVLGFLQHPNAGTRELAAWSLAHAPSRSGLILPALIAALNDPDTEVRCAAAGSLAGLRGRSDAAIPDLLRLMNDSNRKVAWAAKQAVWIIDPTELPPNRR